ncbi:MAG: anion transporter [Acidobacteria bacterium]|nr:anion transporter [Acidobacteriota bacterium]
MIWTAAVIFVLTYTGVALGGIRGLALDRTGIALVGAVAMVVAQVLSPERAVTAIDFPTILLLYALMVVSAQLRLGGFYSRVALSLTRLLRQPRVFLGATMLAGAILSAILANDIVCLAFTPVIIAAVTRQGRDPVPYLLGLAMASNIGSAATIIGNPQNMLIGQLGRLPFDDFLLWCGPPSLAALGTSYLILLGFYGRRMDRDSPPPSAGNPTEAWPAFNRWQSSKGLLLIAAMILLFFTAIPRELSAMGVAAILLCSRHMKTRDILGLIDWHLITLFCALFVVIQGIEAVGLPGTAMAWLAEHGLHFDQMPVLITATVLLSNVVSNVPAVMVLTRFLESSLPEPWYVLGLASTFAGNLLVIGSIANLIVIEQARRLNVVIRFREHARVGIPVTLASLLVLALWVMAG